MNIHKRLKRGWTQYPEENKKRTVCDECGGRLMKAPHGGIYCDKVHKNRIIPVETYTTNGRTITLKRGIAEWFNEDCPDIYDSNGNIIFHSDMSQTYFDYTLQKILYRFVKRSYEMACKKYKWDLHDIVVLQDLRKEYK